MPDRYISVGNFKVTPRMRELIDEVLVDERLSYGPKSKQFEQDFANIHGCKYGVLSNSGTSSLLVALQAMKELHGWKDGDEVIVPALTFVATVNICLHLRLKPILVDVEPDYYGIDTNKIEQVITEKTKATIPVHPFGMPCDIWGVLRLALGNSTYGAIGVINDSCEAMFIKYNGARLGFWGDITCFSTYMAHLLQTGVGGLAITKRLEYAQKMRSLCNHGMIVNQLPGGDEFEDTWINRDFTFDSVGHSFRITEFEAAIGLAQLETWQEMIQQRQANADYLSSGLHELEEWLQLPRIRPDTEHSFMMYPIVCKKEGIRNDLRLHLHKNGIGSRLMLPLTNQPCYKRLFNEDDYPVAKWINNNGFYIGCHPHLSQSDLDYVIEKMREFFR